MLIHRLFLQILSRNFIVAESQVRCIETKAGVQHIDDATRISSRAKLADKAAEGQGCPLCRAGLQNFGYRDVLLLRQFLTPTGLIIGRRHTGVCRKSQARLAKSIRRSRQMGLLPNFRQPKQSRQTHSN